MLRGSMLLEFRGGRGFLFPVSNGLRLYLTAEISFGLEANISHPLTQTLVLLASSPP